MVYAIVGTQDRCVKSVTCLTCEGKANTQDMADRRASYVRSIFIIS